MRLFRGGDRSSTEASPTGHPTHRPSPTPKGPLDSASERALPDEQRDGRSIGFEDERLKVLYVMGVGRSGSTVLGQVLNGIEGFFLVGELYYLWDRGLIENRLCSCGVLFKSCPVWGEVLRRSFGGAKEVDAERALSLRRQAPGNRSLLFASARRRRAAVSQMGEYLEALDALYHGTRSVSQSRVLVDTSKSPAYGFALENVPGVQLYVLHLVRDPRATAYSWGVRKKRQPASEKRPSRYMTTHNPLKTSLFWSAWNFAIEKIWGGIPERYMLLRYEDLIGDPRGALESILEFVGEKDAKLPLVGDHEVSLVVNHAFSGNPDRLRSGSVTLREDGEWKHKMGLALRAMVVATTWPGLLRYGYRLDGRRRPRTGSRIRGRF